MSTPIASFIGPFQVNHLLHCEVLEAAQAPSLAPQEQAVLRNALRSGFLTDTTRKANDYGRTRASALWRRTCLQLKIPFIRFLPRRLYSPAELDLDYAGTCVDFNYRGTLKRALQAYELTKHPKNAQGPTLWSLSQIHLDKISEVADLLLDAAVNHVLTIEECSILMEEKLRREQECCEQKDEGGQDDFDPLAPWEDPLCHY